MPVWCTRVLAQIAHRLCKQVARFDSYPCVVKAISFILSIFILSMVLMPCADTPIDGVASDMGIQETEDHNESDHHDLCSPFCTCHCCHTHITQHYTFCLGELTFFKSNPTEKPFLLVSRISFSIWDPPPFSQHI